MRDDSNVNEGASEEGSISGGVPHGSRGELKEFTDVLDVEIEVKIDINNL